MSSASSVSGVTLASFDSNPTIEFTRSSLESEGKASANDESRFVRRRRASRTCPIVFE